MANRVVACLSPRHVGMIEEPERALGPDEVRIRTLYSGISAGTELTIYRGSNPYLQKRWDAGRRLFLAGDGESGLRYPVTNWGYEESGVVAEVGPGVTDLVPGTLVFGTWGHRSEHIAPAAYARQRILPAGVDPLLGIFSHLGAIALNGTLDSGVHLGETVAVFGLGVVGQVAAQLLRLSGAEVIGVDMVPSRLEIARRAGLERLIDGTQGSAAEQIKDLTGGRGADVCVEASGSAAALNEAIRACTYSSKVVALGFIQGEAHGLYLGEEFHHNRINVVCSQIGGLAPELQGRWDRLRLIQTFMRLVAQGRLQLQPLITHVVPIGHVAGIYEQLDQHPAEVLEAVLDFRVPEAAGR